MLVGNPERHDDRISRLRADFGYGQRIEGGHDAAFGSARSAVRRRLLVADFRREVVEGRMAIDLAVRRIK
jgi:hypothetical protein